MKNRCFVIGPMNEQHINTLRWLAYDVVAKILEEDNFEISTPDRIGTGNIMYNIIKSCDRAQLVVADITGNNPNVLYEMAVTDAMGRACVPVKIKNAQKTERDLIPFDRAQYRSFEIELYKTDEAIKILEPAIHNVLEIQQTGGRLDNPLTDYFGVPLSCFSSSYGIARAYYYNFICPCMEAITKMNKKNPKSNPKVVSIIPDKLENATRSAVDELVRKNIFKPFTIEGDEGRKVNVYVWPKERVMTESLIIVDIPTALVSLRDNVIARLGRNANPDPKSADFQEIQYDEISQFKRYLNRFIDSGAPSLSRTIHENFKIIDIQETKIPEWLKNETNS